jgi:hypothetical protein
MEHGLFRCLIEGIPRIGGAWSEQVMQDHDLDDFVACSDGGIAGIA